MMLECQDLFIKLGDTYLRISEFENSFHHSLDAPNSNLTSLHYQLRNAGSVSVQVKAIRTKRRSYAVNSSVYLIMDP